MELVSMGSVAPITPKLTWSLFLLHLLSIARALYQSATSVNSKLNMISQQTNIYHFSIKTRKYPLRGYILGVLTHTTA